MYTISLKSILHMKYLLSLSIFLLFITGCQQEKERNNPYYPLDYNRVYEQNKSDKAKELSFKTDDKPVVINDNTKPISQDKQNQTNQVKESSSKIDDKPVVISDNSKPISQKVTQSISSTTKITQATLTYKNGAKINLLSDIRLASTPSTTIQNGSVAIQTESNITTPDYEPLVFVYNTILTTDIETLDIIIRISELNNIENNDSNVSFTISKNQNMLLSFNPTESIRQGQIVNNSQWIMEETETFYQFTYIANEGTFSPQALSKIGLSATYHAPHNSKGKFLLAVTMQSGTGDIHQNNDRDSDTITYFNMTDIDPPVITLNGESNMTLALNEIYIEQGASAIDHWYNISVPVDINGTVDTSILGTYTITYSAKDANGLEAITVRTIHIVESIPNIFPIAINDNAVGIENQFQFIDILDNDINNSIEIDKNSIHFTTNTSHGTLTLDALSKVKYTPNANYTGYDYFSYTIKNMSQNISNEANVTIYIAAADGSTDADDDNLSDILEIRFGSDPLVSGSNIGITNSDKNMLHKLARVTWGINAEILDDIEQKGGYDTWIQDQLTTQLIPPENTYDEIDYPAQYKRDNYHMLNYTGVEVPTTIRPLHSKRYLQSVMETFWDNHFNTELTNGQLGTNELYEGDRFYEHAFGNFEEILTISAQSPLMSIYLNGYQNTKEGPNENYAREIMELHTLDIDNYTNQDIVELARVFTGWSYGYDPNNKNMSRYKKSKDDPWRTDEIIYEFRFLPNNHDEGIDKVFLGQTIPTQTGTNGVQEGLTALHILATHPKTAEFICMKLAQKFVSDVPSDTTLQSCKTTFLNNTQNNEQIKEVLLSLFESSEFNNPLTHNNKAKDDQEYLLSLARGLNINATRYLGDTVDGYQNIGWALTPTRLKQPFYKKPEPTGYYETSNYWIRGDNLHRRITESNRLIERVDNQHIVNYFKSLNLTQGTDIIRYLIKIYMRGYYTDEELKLLYDTLYPNNSDFNIEATDAEIKLKDLYHIIALMPNTHLQ